MDTVYLLKVILYFFLYSVIGWISEVIYCSVIDKKLVNRGFLFGPYCPIYGFGSLIILKLLLPIDLFPVLLFFSAIIACTLLEYVTSVVMEKLFNMRWWDYSSHKFNYQGRICVWNSFLFGIMGMVIVYVVHPFVSDIVEHFSQGPIELIGGAIILIMSVDFILSLFSVIRLSGRLKEVKVLFDKLKDSLEDVDWYIKNDVAETIEHLIEKREAVKHLTQDSDLSSAPHLSPNSQLLLEKIDEFDPGSKNLKKWLRISRMVDLQRRHSPLAIIKTYVEYPVHRLSQKNTIEKINHFQNKDKS
ncbi:putative ABC transporter permease [Zophobihabitans entericus]|nr:putative ABC transporter permease [Zophobihabitans entericus]